MGSLRREVMVPVPSYRRPSSLIGISIALVLLASAVDALVWTYQASRELNQIGTIEATDIPNLGYTDVAAIRARALEADVARAEAEMRTIDERVLDRLRSLDEVKEEVEQRPRYFRQLGNDTVTPCTPDDPLCGMN